MFEKLEGVVLRYEDISQELMSPDVVSDQNRFRALMKEQSDLAPVVETYLAYKKADQDAAEAQALLGEESDEEMRALAKEELAEARQTLSALEEKLRILLLPKDPNDDKNVIVEIRAGAGGRPVCRRCLPHVRPLRGRTRMACRDCQLRGNRHRRYEVSQLYHFGKGGLVEAQIRERSPSRAADSGDRIRRQDPYIHMYGGGDSGG